jgi:hypothetical protein
MNAITKLANRRQILRGMLGGGAVTLGLPYLNAFLNGNGTALAATGQALPPCFGTWFCGLGLNPGYWEPKTPGPITEMPLQLKPIEAFKSKMNVYSGMRVHLDSHTPKVHFTGAHAMLSGGIAREPDFYPTIDTLVANHIGNQTRFRSIEVSCNGTRESYSRRSASAINPSEMSPVSLYTRVFGPEFQDPNAADFKPDPRTMARKSVLSAFSDERQGLMRELGAEDRTRLDEYFTALRELEQQLHLQLQKPAPLEACSMPNSPEDGPHSLVIDHAMNDHKLFAKLLAYALACGQTRIVNIVFDGANGNLRTAGSPLTFHIHTHEEPVDPALGYQRQVGWFQEQVFTSLNELLIELDGVREGDGTLLDRIVIMYGTDTGLAKFHTLENMPMFTFGGGGGRMKTGIHVPANGDTTSRVGLTVQQALGLPVARWGTESNETSRTITEVMA